MHARGGVTALRGRGSPEAEVVVSLKRHLKSVGIRQRPVSSILVDADASYRASRFASELEPMVCVPIDGFRPDLVCSLESPTGPLVVGIEVKARLEDWPTGLAQARAYRAGVHQAYLALPAGRREDRRLVETAAEHGVGLLIRTHVRWDEIVAPADPRPLPEHLRTTSLALRGVPAVRRLQLNHPLNYLVVPYLVALHPARSAIELLEAYWPDLGSPGSRRHAVEGARMLGLLGTADTLTPLGATAADLLVAVRFDPRSRIDKRRRLASIAPEVAAIARAVLLQQPAVRLVVETLGASAGHSASATDLVERACRYEEVLARSLFLSDPGLDLARELDGADFNPSTVYKFKQVLWHAGLVAEKAAATAGGAGTRYQPALDRWTLDRSLVAAGHMIRT